MNEIQNLISELKKLESLWSKNYPNRARGGRVAISGFRYQFYLFLNKLVQEWISYNNDERCEINKFLSDMERLSDIISISKSGIIITTQSKLTLRSSSLEDALDEFQTIHDTAQKVCSSIVPQIKYRILCSSLELKSINVAIKNWEAKHQIHSPKTLSFVGNVEVEVESFPENSILVLLSNTFKCPDPLKTIHRWLGHLLDCVQSPDSMKFFGKLVWDELNSLWRNCNGLIESIYIWQDIDYPPENVTKGSVLIGQRPNVYHLRKGYFSSRTQVYNDIEKSFLSLIDSIDPNSMEKIQLFWIGGRSGSGKSVALLHLLASLNEKGYGPIVWVGHKTSLLRSAVKFIIESEKICNMPIIAIDDPYIVGIDNNVSQHWDEVFAYLHSYQQDGNFKSMPLFIACGPTEQAHLFKCDYNEYIDFNIRELPQETTKENEELRIWYQQRTGDNPPVISDENSLMVQLFFQWDRHQSIIEFSTRLKDRLIQGDLSKGIFYLVSKIISLNRLYIGYPQDAVKNDLTPEQKDLLSSLESELHLGERERNGVNGYWLLHAHLANALYLNWFETKQGSYIEHLKAATIDSILFGDNPNEKTAPLWAISRVFRQTTKDELNKRLNENDAKGVLLDVYNFLKKKYNTITISMLPVWVEIFAIKPDLILSPSPIDLAIDVINPINTGETGFRLLCHKLMQHFNSFHYSKQQQIRDAIVELLVHTTHWNEWFPIIKDALIVLKDQRLFLLVYNVFNKDFNYNMAELLYLTIQESPDDIKICKLALEKLINAPCTYYWIEIVKIIVKNSNNTLDENIISWLNINKDNKYICFVLKEALKKFYNSVRDIALHWANLWYSLNYASFVLEPLIEHEGDNEQITKFCYQWILTTNSDKSFMFEKLLGTGSVSPEIISAVVVWLNEVDTKNPAWLFAWEALHNIQKTNISSYELGMNWLKQNSKDHKAWPYVWNDLYRIKSEDKELLDMGTQWINEADANQILWQKVLKNLLRSRPYSPELKKITQEWFKYIDITGRTWPYIWQNVYRENPRNIELINLGKKWLLESNIDHSAWSYIWQNLYKVNPRDIELINLGKKWLLESRIDHLVWSYIWQNLYKVNPRDIELINLGKKWLLESNRNHFVWFHIWNTIFKYNICDEETFNLGLEWINDISYNNKYWSGVWEELFRVRNDNHELMEIAEKWLQGVDYNTSRWHHIWQKLYKSNYEDKSTLIELGKSWLNIVDRNHGGWVSIWDSVYKADLKNTNLFNIGLDFLNNLDSEDGTWGNVWSLLFKANSEDTYLFDIGYKYIKDTRNRKISTRNIWLSLTSHDSLNKDILKNKEIFNIGFKWIEKNDFKDTSWQYIWLRLYEIDPKKEYLNEYGILWLKYRLNYKGAWPEVAIRLIESCSGDLRVISEAKEWLYNIEINHASWPGLWIRVIKYQKTDHLLYEKGYNWLKQSVVYSKYWTSIWIELITYYKKDNFLLNNGLEWTAKNLIEDPHWDEIFTILDKNTTSS